jgi:hypothetical protein
LVTVELRAASLDAALDPIAPEIRKWATVCIVEKNAAGALEFFWHDYRDSGSARDFWPASTIKLYAAIATLELLPCCDRSGRQSPQNPTIE